MFARIDQDGMESDTYWIPVYRLPIKGSSEGLIIASLVAGHRRDITCGRCLLPSLWFFAFFLLFLDDVQNPYFEWTQSQSFGAA